MITKIIGFTIAGILIVVAGILFAASAARLVVHMYNTMSLGKALIVCLAVCVAFFAMVAVTSKD